MAFKDQLSEQISALASESIQYPEVFLVDIEIKGDSRNPLVWVYLESEKGGINLDECAEISRKLQFLIEAHEIFKGNFTLNVSSPGLDRPLKDLRQYKINRNRHARIRVKSDEKAKTIEGIIKEVSDSEVTLETKNENVVLPFDKIIETKIIPVV